MHILPHAGFTVRGNGSRTGTYLPFLQKVIKSAQESFSLDPPEGKRALVVSIFNRVKNKELTGASGQESVVLAAEVEKLGHCLHRGMNFP